MNRFPLLHSRPDWPASVPWSMVLPFEHRARLNHSQSLEGLAQRGGLSPMQLYCVVMDIDPWTDLEVEGDAEAIEIIRKWLRDHGESAG